VNTALPSTTTQVQKNRVAASDAVFFDLLVAEVGPGSDRGQVRQTAFAELNGQHVVSVRTPITHDI
jgi:hypothetical protein